MKKISFLLAAMLLMTTAKTNAQEDAERECKIKYNLFKGDYKSKKYDDALVNWNYLMDNCQDLSVNIYKYGANIAEDVLKEYMSKDCSISQKRIQQKYIVIMLRICPKTN